MVMSVASISYLFKATCSLHTPLV